jgi:replicative DNA helicase
MDETKLTLPFSEEKQRALLGHLILNPKFFKNSCARIKPNWFLKEKESRIYQFLMSYNSLYNTHPTPYELKSYREILALDPKDRANINAYISSSLSLTTTYKLSSLKQDLTDWLHSVILLNALKDSEKLFNKQNVKECHSRLMTAVNEVNGARFNDEEEMQFAAFGDYLKKSEVERGDALTTGLTVLDAALLEGGGNGGLLKGDTTIIEAPLGTGKSSSIITVIVNNVKRCKSVLYMTHEDKPEDIRLKVLASYLNVKLVDLFKLYKTKEGCEKLETASKILQKYLKYIPYNKAGKMIVEEIIPIIRNTQEERVANNNGKGFDLLAVDYPAVLTTQLAYRGNLQKRNIDDIVYNNYIQLAFEYKFHSLLAIQTNREGSKINKGQNGVKRILSVEDVQESFGPLQSVANVLTLNRSPEYEKNEYMVLGIAKSRTNKKNTAVFAKTNFTHCVAFSNELGGFSWAGSKCPDGNIDNILKEYNGMFVPDDKAKSYGLS